MAFKVKATSSAAIRNESELNTRTLKYERTDTNRYMLCSYNL